MADTVDTSASKRCPYCAETIKKDAIVCRYCGRELVPNADAMVRARLLEEVRREFTEPTPQARKPQTQEKKSDKKGTSLIGLFLTLCVLPVVCLMVLGGPSTSDGCYVPAYKDDAGEVMSLWADAHDIARHSPRTLEALVEPVAVMLAARDSARQMAPPDCALPAHQAMLEYMDAVLLAYDAFMQGDEAKGNRLLNQAYEIGDKRAELHRALRPGPGER